MEFNEKELLDFVLKNDIINVEATLEKMELMERREILALHPYKITERPDYYATYITGTDGKRKYRIRHTRKEIEDLIISCYKDKIQEIYLKDVFLEWVNKKLEYNEIQRTSYDRYINDYKRFLQAKQFLFYRFSCPVRKKCLSIQPGQICFYFSIYDIRSLCFFCERPNRFFKNFVLFESFFVFPPSNKQIHKNKEASTLTSQPRPVRKPGEGIYD